MLDVEVTKSYWALEENRKPIALLEGSTRSGKTWAIIEWLIAQATSRRVKIFAARHDGTTCERTIVADFKEVMGGQLEAWEPERWNATTKTYSFASGSLWEFGGTKDVAKLHGHKQDILWLNEVMEISYEAWKQLTQRTSELRILDWNPSMSHHWVFERIMKRPPSEYTYCHTTYLDNPFLSAGQVAEIESTRPTPENLARGTADEWHWTVYGLGKRGRRQGQIYTLWDVVEEFPGRMDCQRYGFGLDFGFSLDPSTLIECGLFQEDVWLRQKIYETELLVTRNISKPSVPSIQSRMEELEIDKTVKIYADSAEPGSIRDLQLTGFNLVPAEKGADSVNHGIDLLRRRRIHVDISSIDLQRELENYVWKKRLSDGVYLDEPEDKWNHALDAVRYWAASELRMRRDVPRSPQVAETPFSARQVGVVTPRRRPVSFRPLVAPNPFSGRRNS